jgi:2-dehydro-3-deoxyphosphogluconate aldolase/(4S)-4-hydroxy-2-oxoglutarate aldolase
LPVALHDTMTRLAGAKVVPVVRTSTPEFAATAVGWLVEAGLRVFEITLTIPDANAVIAELAKRDGLLIGVGTAMEAGDAHAALDAGARFVVSPCLSPELPDVCHAAEAPCLLGAMTPSEVRAAAVAGADAVKIFPASSVGGPSHVKALKAVFPDVALVPTGGIAADQVSDYLSAGAAFVGMGGRLVDEKLIAAGDRAAVIEAGRDLLKTLGDA